MRKLIVFLLFLIPIFGFADSEFLRDRGYLGISLGIGTQAPDGSLDVVGSEAYLPAPASVAADGNFSPSQWSMSLDEVANKFKLKAKESGGTTFEATIEQVRAGIHYNILKDSNPGLEDGVTTPFTASGSPTAFAVETTATNVGFGAVALAWDSSAAETLNSTLVSIPPGLYGQQCEARFWVKGGSELLTFKVTDGTNELASRVMSTPSVYKEEILTFVCPSSGSVDIEIAASADAPVAYFDDFYIGESLNDALISQGSTLVASAYYAPVAGCNPSINSATFVDVPALGSCPPMTVVHETQTVNVVDDDTLNIVFDNLSAGTYTITSFAHMESPDSLAVIGMRIASSTGAFGNTCLSQVATNGPSNHRMICTLTETLTSSQAVTYRLQAFETGASAGLVLNDDGGGTRQTEFHVKRWAAPINQRAIIPEMQGWFVSANLGGGNVIIGNTTNADHTEMTNATLDLVLDANSAPATVPCDGANPSTGLTCAVGLESVGIQTNIPISGTYEFCGQFMNQITAANQQITNTYSWAEVPDVCTGVCDGPDFLQQASARLENGHNDINGLDHDAIHLCGQMTFTTPGIKTLLIVNKRTGSVNANQINADRAALNGGRNISITVKPIAPHQPAPLLISSLNTPSTDKTFALFSAYLSIDASNCVNLTEIGDWIDGTPTRVSAGRCSFSFKAGTFSGVPVCVCNALRGHPNSGYCLNQSVTQTGYDFYVSDEAGTEVNANVQLMCHGPR